MPGPADQSTALDLEAIIQDSKRQSGLAEIGEPDINEGLGILIDALNREARLSEKGIQAFRHNLTQVLVKRQRIQRTFEEHPEILGLPIRGPVFITGLPRSGTTKLQRMLAVCPEFHKLPLWKILNPLPIGPPDDNGVDARIPFADEASRIMREQFPDFYAGHPMNTHDPDEEEWLLDLAMKGYTNPHVAWVPSFERWMDGQTFDSWYIYLKKLLQLYQWQDGGVAKPWILKAPSHLRHIKLLFKYFPDAVLVHCHRDPVTTTASLAGLMEAAHHMYSDYDHPIDIGAFTLRHWSQQMAGYVRDRPELEKRHPFVDVPYRDIVGNTLNTIDAILDAGGISVSEESRAAMSHWESNNPPGKHGTHHYSLERYELTPDYIRGKYQDYLARFGHLI